MIVKKKKQYTDYLPFEALTVNPRVQRAIVTARVNKLSAEWDFGKVGVLTISLRDGVPFIVDGQHRWKAGVDSGYGKSKVLCHVYTDLTEQEEGALFLALNDTRAVSPVEKYLIGLVAEEEPYVSIEATLNAYGLRVANSSSGVTCVTALITAHNEGLLPELCEILTGAWGPEPEAFNRVIVSGMTKFLGRYNGEVNRDTLTKKLAKAMGPNQIVGKSRQGADFSGTSITSAAAEVLRGIYNRGRAEATKLAPV